MRPWLLALVVIPGLALAQTVPTVTMTSGTGVSTANLKCGDALSVTWTVAPTTSVSYCDDLQFWSEASGSCGAIPDGGFIGTSVAPGTFATSATGNLQLSTSDLNLGTECASPTGQTVTASVCGGVDYGSGISLCSTPAAATIVPLVVTVYVQPPTVNGVTLTPSDQTLGVKIDTASQIAGSTIYYSASDGDGGAVGSWQSVSGSSTDPTTGSISNLTNGTVYCVQASVSDAVGQVSALSAVTADSCMAPQHIDGFYTRFYAAGGRPTGCSFGGEGGLLALALTGLWPMLSRRKR